MELMEWNKMELIISKLISLYHCLQGIKLSQVWMRFVSQKTALLSLSFPTLCSLSTGCSAVIEACARAGVFLLLDISKCLL